MTNLIRRFLGAPMPMAVRGEGPYLIDDSGRRYLDAASGAGVSSLGYDEREIADAVCRQVHDLAFVVHASFTSQPAEMLAQELARRAPQGSVCRYSRRRCSWCPRHVWSPRNAVPA